MRFIYALRAFALALILSAATAGWTDVRTPLNLPHHSSIAAAAPSWNLFAGIAEVNHNRIGFFNDFSMNDPNCPDPDNPDTAWVVVVHDDNSDGTWDGYDTDGFATYYCDGDWVLGDWYQFDSWTDCNNDSGCPGLNPGYEFLTSCYNVGQTLHC